MQGLRQASELHSLILLFWTRLRDSEIVKSSCLRQVILAWTRIPQVVSSCETYLIASTCSMRFRRDFWWWSRSTVVDGGGYTCIVEWTSIWYPRRRDEKRNIFKRNRAAQHGPQIHLQKENEDHAESQKHEEDTDRHWRHEHGR